MIHYFLLIFSFFTFISNSYATQVLPMDARQMTYTADLVAYGIFLGSEPTEVEDPDNGKKLPATLYHFEKKECLKGDCSAKISFLQFGATRRNAEGLKRLYVHGTPDLKVGKEYLIFLTPKASGTGFRSFVGLGQGRFEVRQDATGNKSVVNDFNNEDLFKVLSPAKGIGTGTKDVAPEMPGRGPVSYDQFKTLIQDWNKEK